MHEMMTADIQFIQTKMSEIPGWVNGISAAATFVLLHAQDEIQNTGNFVEIGTYGGKYLSTFARHAQRAGGRTIGIDTFIFFSQAQVTQNILGALGTSIADLVLRKSSSQDLTSEEICSLMECKVNQRNSARMIHIDGSHERDDVLWDLEISEPLLSPAGILVIDDFFQAYDSGVTEAVFRFQIMRPRPLAPIAYVANKLFLCRHSHAEYYRTELEKFLMSDDVFPASSKFRERLTKQNTNRRMIETNLFGHPYLIVTG